MGLDIVAYSGLTPDNTGVVGEACGVFDQTSGLLRGDLVSFYQHPCYHLWYEPLVVGQAYKYREKLRVCNGSYSLYGHFRDTLFSILMDYLQVEPTQERTRKNSLDPWDPFYELMVFSDCEGAIGWPMCQKLHKDFIDMRVFAWTSCDDMYFRAIYDNCIDAFALSMEGGAVRFC